MMGGHPSVGWQGCAPHVLNHQWVRVGGVLCVWWGGGGMVGGWGWVGGWQVGVWGMGVGGGGLRVGRGLVEGRGSVKWGGDKESWAYTGLEDGWRMEGARRGDSEWQDQCRRWTGNQNGRCSLQGVSLEGSRRPMPGWRVEGGRREYSDWLREEANGWLL